MAKFQAARAATYKGKSYKVVWSGRTKSGKQMTKLAFWSDASKEFWVDTDRLDSIQSQQAANSRASERPSRAQREYDRKHRPAGAGWGDPFSDDYIS